ncbi:MAG: hypothetical protein IKT30_07885, partial [Bacteroidaceae bacterium]|nr:hypothetical protein [Bacteroidaceae bacterium]
RYFFSDGKSVISTSILGRPNSILMSNPFGGIGGICVSKKLRTLHADVPTFSLLIAHSSLSKNMIFCSSV